MPSFGSKKFFRSVARLTTGSVYRPDPAGSTQKVRVATGLGSALGLNTRARTTQPLKTSARGGRPPGTVGMADKSLGAPARLPMGIVFSYSAEPVPGSDPSRVKRISPPALGFVS